MTSRLFRIDPFLCAMLITVALASLLPVRGNGAVVAQAVTDAGIALLFFLQGAKLSASAIKAGLAVRFAARSTLSKQGDEITVTV